MQWRTHTVVLAICIFFFAVSSSEAGILQSVAGKQFAVVGVSTGAIPVYTDAFSFGENGTFTMEKIASDGQGKYYEYAPGLFYCMFIISSSSSDVQEVEAYGCSLNTPFGQAILGVGFFMINYVNKPMAFIGIAVTQS